MEIPINPTEIIQQMRSWFFANDRSIVLASDTFIQSPEITTPPNANADTRRIYPKSDGWYSLEDDGTETIFIDNSNTKLLNSTISLYQSIPGLVGFWPMSSVQRSAGNVYDLSAQGRTLTYNGNPTFNYTTPGMAYCDYDGTGDYHSRADETDLDISGIESIYNAAVQGLTLGGWFYFDALGAATRSCITKYTTSGNQRSYTLEVTSSSTPRIVISSDGTFTNTDTKAHSTSLSTGQWYFIVGRWNTSSITLFLNDSSESSASAEASIFNGTAPLNIGGKSGGLELLDGRASLCFVSANSLSDNFISQLYQQSRGLFGV